MQKVSCGIIKTFQDCPLKIDMTEANYRFSIPDNEVEFGKVDK